MEDSIIQLQIGKVGTLSSQNAITYIARLFSSKKQKKNKQQIFFFEKYLFFFLNFIVK